MPAAADFERLRRLESRQLFSLHRELLIALYAGVATLVAGVGLLVRDNLDRIGPATLVAALLAAAGACYATAIRTRRRGATRSLAGDYLLLLGAVTTALLVWSWHFSVAVLRAPQAPRSGCSRRPATMRPRSPDGWPRSK